MGHLCDTWDDEHLDQLWHETRGTKMKRPLRAVPMCCRFMLKPPLYHVSNSIPLLGKIPQLCRVPAEECRVQSSSLCAKVQQAADSSRNCWCGLENQTQNSTFLQTSPHVCPLQIPVPSISIFTSLQDLTKRSPSPSNKWLLQRISKCSCYIYIYVPQKKRPKNVLVFVRTPSGRALLPDLRETAKAELHSVESMEDPRTTWEQRGMEKCGGEMVCVVKP